MSNHFLLRTLGLLFTLTLLKDNAAALRKIELISANAVSMLLLLFKKCVDLKSSTLAEISDE